MKAKTDVLTAEEFLKDVAQHQLTVYQDDGVYRHLRFRAPKTTNRYFELVTWPGYLAFTGDMGCYVFARIPDMLQFFRVDPKCSARQPSGLYVNHSYWAEKVEARDRSGVIEYDPDRFVSAVNEKRVGWMRDSRARLTKAQRRELWAAVEDEVLYAADEGHHEALSAALGFSKEFPGAKPFTLEGLLDYRLEDYTYRFRWCCFALAWGVQQYDAMKGEVS
jgi:hypothetical protein